MILWRACTRWLRRRLLAADRRDPSLPTDLPASLAAFSVGEVLPWKGTMFRVGKIVGGECPAMILIPHQPTRGAQLRALRRFRDLARTTATEQRETARALKKAVH